MAENWSDEEKWGGNWLNAIARTSAWKTTAGKTALSIGLIALLSQVWAEKSFILTSPDPKFVTTGVLGLAIGCCFLWARNKDERIIAKAFAQSADGKLGFKSFLKVATRTLGVLNQAREI